MNEPTPPVLGWRLIGIFLGFGAVMLAVAAASLAYPDGPLAVIWTGQSAKRHQLAAVGWPLVAGFVVLSSVFVATTWAWFTRRRWGWRVAVTLIFTNLAGDVAQLASGHLLEGIIGIVFAGLLVWYMLRAPLRQMFS